MSIHTANLECIPGDSGLKAMDTLDSITVHHTAEPSGSTERTCKLQRGNPQNPGNRAPKTLNPGNLTHKPWESNPQTPKNPKPWESNPQTLKKPKPWESNPQTPGIEPSNPQKTQTLRNEPPNPENPSNPGNRTP